MVRADCYFSPLLVHRTYEGLTVNHAPSHYSLLSLLRNDCLREKNSGSFSSVFCAFHDELGSHHFPQMSVVVAIVVMIVQVALKNVRCAFIKFHSIGLGFVCVVLCCVVLCCVVLCCDVLCCVVLCCVVLCCVVLCRVLLCCVVLCCVVSCCVVLCRVVSCCIVLYCIVLYYILN